MALRAVTLDDKYRLDRGRVYLTGTQALVRLPVMQRQRDAAAGLNTGCFISGYRGSPLGGLDQALWQARRLGESNHIEFQPAINEELGATAIWGSQQLNLFPGARYDGVFAMWYGKGPGVDRSGDALKHGNAAGSARHGGVLLLAGDDHTCKSSTLRASVRIRVHRRGDPGAEPVRGRGNPRFRPLRLGDVALFGLLGRAQDGGRDDGQFGLDRGRSGTGSDPSARRLSRCPTGGLNIRWPDPPLEQEDRLHDTSSMRRCAFAGANRLDRIVIDVPTPRFGIVTTGKSYLDVRQALDDLGIDDADAAEIGLSSLQGRRCPGRSNREGIRHFAEGLEEILVVEEKRAVIEYQLKEQLYNWRDRRAAAGHRQVRRERATGCLPSSGELTPARSRGSSPRASPASIRRRASMERLARSRGEGAPTRRQLSSRSSARPVLLLRLPAQHLDQGARGQPRARPASAAIIGALDGPLDRDLHPDGRRGRAVDRPGAVHRDASTSSPISATAPTTIRVSWRSAPRSPPRSTSPTRSSSTTRWR